MESFDAPQYVDRGWVHRGEKSYGMVIYRVAQYRLLASEMLIGPKGKRHRHNHDCATLSMIINQHMTWN